MAALEAVQAPEDALDDAAAFVPFPSIGKLSDVVKEAPFVFRTDGVPPTLTYRGTVKLHGTNASLVMREEGGGVTVQSRNRVITVESDNQECAKFFHDHEATCIPSLFDLARARLGVGPVVICGEYCGRGIQSRVAVCSLPRMFVIFAIRTGRKWHHAGDPGFEDVHAEEHGVYSIARAPTFTLVVDMADPAPALAQAEALTQAIDTECPFAKGLGAVGRGEGIVWTCCEHPSPRLWFKTKGLAHVTPLVRSAPTAATAAKAATADGVAWVGQHLVTEQRLAQGLDYVREMNGAPCGFADTKTFTQWVAADALKEERDVIAGSGLKEADVRKAISRLAGAWLRANVSTNV